MRDGFIKVASATPKIKVADPAHNAQAVIALMREAAERGVRVMAFPELCLTGYTCGDLFLQDALLKGAEEALGAVLEGTKSLEVLAAVGLPVKSPSDNKLYNCAAIILKGKILGLVPKTYIPNYGEFYEGRWFAPGQDMDASVELCHQQVPLRADLIWACESMPNLVIGVEICEDLWAAEPPSNTLARAGATLILNLSASDEVVGKTEYRRELVRSQSARCLCGYVYADAGEGESTTDLVFAGHNMIAENGALLAETRFETGLTVGEIDVDKLSYERRRMNTFTAPAIGIGRAFFSLRAEDTPLTRPVAKSPWKLLLISII